jgi:glycosyltransferase involved in cell wall biosynthesis
LTIGVVGELTRRKGVSDLPAIADKCSEADFFVYGSGPLEGILRGRPNVHLKGYEVDPGRIYSHIDVLLMMSYQEPFGRVATEAFSAMVPVIEGGQELFRRS